MRPRFAFIFRPLEGVGNAGGPLHPRPRVHFALVESTRVTTSTPEHPAFPHAMVFCTEDWTGQITLIRFNKFARARERRGRVGPPDSRSCAPSMSPRERDGIGFTKLSLVPFCEIVAWHDPP